MAVMKIPVTKGKGSVDIDTETIPDHVYQAALAIGLKQLVNGGTTKITKETYPVPAELQAAAMAKAQERVEQINAGTIRIVGQRAEGKAPGEVMTEARRLAKNFVKDEMKRQGVKVSSIPAKELTLAANAIIADDASWIDLAKKSLEDRRAKTPTGNMTAVMQSLIGMGEKAKPKGKPKADVLSAAQAGKVAKHKPTHGAPVGRQ